MVLAREAKDMAESVAYYSELHENGAALYEQRLLDVSLAAGKVEKRVEDAERRVDQVNNLIHSN